MSDDYRHDLERRWHDETWCAIAGSPECGCGCIPVAEEIARAMCDRIAELEAENRRMREALEKIAAPTFGTELWNTHKERAEIYRTHLISFQTIARAALSQEDKP